MAKQDTLGWLFGWLFKWADEHGCELHAPRDGVLRVTVPLSGHHFELGRYMCIEARQEGRKRNELVARLNDWWEAVEAANRGETADVGDVWERADGEA